MDNLFLFLALGLSYWKTGEFFSMFAPEQLAGFNSVSVRYIYGYSVALLVELFIFHRYKQLRRTMGDSKQAAFIFGLVGVAVSIFANALDTAIVNETVDQLDPIVKASITWLAPSMPALFFALHYASAYFDTVTQSEGKPSASPVEQFGGMIANAQKRLVNAVGGGAKPNQPPRKPSPIVQGVESGDPKAEAPNIGAKG